jgi:hypothetical protein
VREPSKPSTAKCKCALYTLFLLAEPKYVSCVRLSEIRVELSPDSVNRFLMRENYTPEDLFNEVTPHLILTGGVLSGDDSVVDKPSSNPQKMDGVGYLGSGKHQRAVKGSNLITLYYTDLTGTSYPVNYRL